MDNSIEQTQTEQREAEQVRLEQLIARVAIRDQKAFKTLYENTSSRTYSMALQMMGTAQPAQDLLQEAYLKIWANAKEYRPDKGAVMSWMLGIVRYRALDALRASKRRTQAMGSHFQSVKELNPLGKMRESNDTGDGLSLCLETLAGSQRESIVQAFVYGWTYEELASRMEKPIGTIKSQIRRGLARLKECLER